MNDRQPQSMPRHDMFKSPQTPAQQQFVTYTNDGQPIYQAEDPDYEYYEYDEDPTKDEYDLKEEEYISFLQEFGHQDFTLLDFLPKVRTVTEFVDNRQDNFIKTPKVQRAETLLGGNFEIDKQMDYGMLDLKMKKKQGKKKDTKAEMYEKMRTGKDLTQIDERPEEDTIKEKEPSFGDKEKDGSVQISTKSSTVRAERLNFSFNQHFIKHNIKVDKYGERITAYSTKVGRIVSRDCMSFEPLQDISNTEYDYFDRHGNKIPKPMEAHEIPLEELTHVFYFQYRIDRVMDPESIHPKIIVGVCRDTFNLNQDVSRARDLWCMNLATGDINTGKKWNDYYPIEETPEPPYGYFDVGCIIGICVDMQRGIIAFYKDGYELGQAFVETRLKYGDLYPFVETQEECELSIFHPFVYPAYRSPLDMNQHQGDESTYNWHTVNDTGKQLHGSDKQSEGGDNHMEKSLHSKGSEKLRKKKKKPKAGDSLAEESVRQSEKQSYEEDGEEKEKEKGSWVPNMFTNMFGGDNKTPDGDEDGQRGRSSKTSKTGSIFTPVAGLLDAARRSLSRGRKSNAADENAEDDEAQQYGGGAQNGGGKQSNAKDEKENRRKKERGEQVSQEGGNSRVSERGGRKRRRSRSRGSRRSRDKDNRGSELDQIADPVAAEKARRDDYDKKMDRQKQQVIKDMRESQKNINESMQDGNNMNNRSVRINDIDINLDDIDMGKLTKEQNKDIQQIERLEREMDQLTAGNMTLGNVDEIDKNFSMRPTVLSGSSQKRQIGNLQYEIEKYQKEIELLKLKLQFKHQIMSYKTMERNRGTMYQQQYQGDVNYQTDPCTIF